YEGQVVRIPYGVDDTAPEASITSVTLGDADHTAIDVSGASVSDGVLVVDHAGIVVTATISDGASGSGVDDEDVKLSLVVDGQEKEVSGTRVSDEDGSYQFALDSDSVGAGVFSLDGVTITVSDKAGNSASSATLAQASPFADSAVGQVRIIDDSSSRFRPTLRLDVSGAQRDADGSYVTGNADTPATVDLVITDRNLSWLMSLSKWTSGQPLRLTVSHDGTQTQTGLDVSQLSRVGDSDSCVMHGIQTLSAEGLHQVRVDYCGFTSLLVRNDRFASGTASVTIDTTPPALTAAQLEDGDVDADHDIADYGGKKVLVGSDRVLKVRVQDLLPDLSDEQKAQVTGRDMQGTAGMTTSSSESVYVDVTLGRRESPDASESVYE
ncbi:MAG: hypothetical protein ACI364_06905, partial [Coriobacteriales bacterium]